MADVSPDPEIRILNFLKQRFPLLMVDRILSWEKGREIRVVKNISVNDVHFQGHFPEVPIFPGVLTIECFAQAATILIRLTENSVIEGVFDVIGSVMDFHFYQPLVPGDRLEVHVVLHKVVEPNYIVHGKGYVEGKEVASGKFLIGKLRIQ